MEYLFIFLYILIMNIILISISGNSYKKWMISGIIVVFTSPIVFFFSTHIYGDMIGDGFGGAMYGLLFGFLIFFNGAVLFFVGLIKMNKNKSFES